MWTITADSAASSSPHGTTAAAPWCTCTPRFGVHFPNRVNSSDVGVDMIPQGVTRWVGMGLGSRWIIDQRFPNVLFFKIRVCAIIILCFSVTFPLFHDGKTSTHPLSPSSPQLSHTPTSTKRLPDVSTSAPTERIRSLCLIHIHTEFTLDAKYIQTTTILIVLSFLSFNLFFFSFFPSTRLVSFRFFLFLVLVLVPQNFMPWYMLTID